MLLTNDAIVITNENYKNTTLQAHDYNNNMTKNLMLNLVAETQNLEKYHMTTSYFYYYYHFILLR